MSVSIDWDDKIISVPKAYMTLIQENPTEIRQLDLFQFHYDLRNLESSEEGVPYLPTHNHVAPISVGSVTLARVIEIINDYTITFEDDQYAVNVIGGNTNLGDRVNVNQVSVRISNSAGLVTSDAIEYGEYNGEVTVDVLNGTSGTVYPKGTLRRPVNNFQDAMMIALVRGFPRLKIIHDALIDSACNVDSMVIEGVSHVHTHVTMAGDTSCVNCTISNCNVDGVLDGGTHLTNCMIGDISYVNGHIHNCGLYGTVELGGNEDAVIAESSAIDVFSVPTIDMGGSGQNVIVTDWSGNIIFSNLTTSDNRIFVQMDGGTITLDSSITGGTICLNGVGALIDYSTNTTIYNNLVNLPNIASDVWEEPLATHTNTNTAGEHLQRVNTQLLRAMGLMHRNYRLSNPVYVGNLLQSADVTTYTDNTLTTILESYTITVTHNGNLVASHQMVNND